MPCVAEMASKIVHNGIETSEAVTYQGWEPGKEYTKNIVLKNVKVKTQKITYNSPSSRFFSTLYPKQITLSAGTSYVLPVTFRPLEKNIYEDQIQFASKDGDFAIPIKAVLPVFNVGTPEQMTLTTCAVKDETQLHFTITNKSELVTPFQWDVQEPFSIEPSSGTLKPFGTAKMTVYFRPTAALVYQCQAKCLHGTNLDSVATTILDGTGKYPLLLIAAANKPYDRFTQATLDFGHVPISTEVIRTIEVFNQAQVEAKCTIEQPTSVASLDTVFSLAATRIIVPPMSSVTVQVKYRPMNVGTSSIDYMYISSISDIRKMCIKCTGHCTGPKVSLSVNLINFSLINVGESATKTLEITNQSDAVTHYQFKLDCAESVYKFDYPEGQLAPGQTKKIIIKFWPTHAINYYRNIACVVDNQDPIFLELLATAHSETVKPAVLESKHLTQFRTHMERGLSIFPPEQLNEMLATGKLELDSNNTLMSPLPKLILEEFGKGGTLSQPSLDYEAESIEPWLSPVETVPAMDLHFNDGYHSDIVHLQPHVSLEEIHTDFGQCIDWKNVEPKTVRMTNNTKGKIIAQWMGDDSHVFYVTPAVMEIPPLKTIDFRIHFSPDKPNNFYSNELECFCYYKSLRDFRLVETLSHAPPFCLTHTAIASTFQQNQQTFPPSVKLSTQSLVFPATNQNESSYRTITVTNEGKTPVVYDFPDMETFSIKPKKGMIKSKYEVFVVKALPTNTRSYKKSLSLCMNQDTKFTQEIPVSCTAETAEILLSNNGEIFFKQTCIGTSTSQLYQIKNISRMPLEFRWLVKNQDQGLVTAEPSTGLILPNEFQEHRFTFTPTDTQRYLMKPVIIVQAKGQSKQQSGGKPRAFPVRAIGLGCVGELKAGDAYVEFGNVLVGSSGTKTFNICNNGDCLLKYRLSVDQKVEGNSADQQISSGVLVLDRYEGEIPARSKQTIRGVVKPLLRCQYSFEIKYELIKPETKVKVSEPQQLTTAFVCGVFPLMAVTDARIHGSGIGIGKKQLWDLFQLDNLNMFLDSDPSEKELRYSVQTRNSTRKRPPVLTRAIIDFNFGAAPTDSEPCYVTLHVENTGTVSCEWEFLFPNDLQIDLEQWSESGEYTQDELHEMKVMDNKLFSVSPKLGKLEPGGTCAITLTYHHFMPGTDRVPVLLKLSRGREILMNFIGVTVEDNVPYIHFPSNTHHFAPVAVGEKQCPKQLYELYNGGSIPVTFEIDALPLDELQSENFDHRVLECLNPKGVIAPGKTHLIEWMFHPLEAKTYQVDVPIRISKGDPALITFTGIGYDKTQLGDTMPPVSENTRSTVPSIQAVTVPGQNVVLSHERVSFGNLPLFCKSRKVVFMSNTSDHTVSYSWHVTNAGDQRIVNIFPAKGTIKPRCNQMIKVAFTSFGDPAFFDMDMICEIIDETELARYRRKLRDWETERERQLQEFTITEKDLIPAAADTKHSATSTHKSNKSLKINKAADQPDLFSAQPKEKTYKPYKTLPPILDRTIDKDRQEASESQRMKIAMWQKPIVPKPFLIHLGVIARTHSIPTFQDQFFDEFTNFFIDKTLGQQPGASETESQVTDEPSPFSCTEAEGDMMTGVIANVLRSLVDDPSFHQSVTKLTSEATPYFNQFRPKPSVEGGMEDSSRSALSIMDTPLPPSQASAIPLSGSPTKQQPVTREGLSKSRAGPIVESSATGKSTARRTSTEKTPTTETSTEVCDRSSVNERITRLPAFGNVVEDIIENTLMNIMLEAASSEVNITARPRLIALPPRKGASPRDKH